MAESYCERARAIFPRLRMQLASPRSTFIWRYMTRSKKKRCRSIERMRRNSVPLDSRRIRQTGESSLSGEPEERSGHVHRPGLPYRMGHQESQIPAYPNAHEDEELLFHLRE